MPKPSLFTDKIAAEIIRRLSDGETMTKICADAGMPSVRTVTNWQKAHKAFGDAYDQAMLEGCHTILDDTLKIADNLKEDPASRRVRIWARHELIKRKRPKEFGDRVALDHGVQDSLADKLKAARERAGKR